MTDPSISKPLRMAKSTAATPGQADAFVQIHIFQDPSRCLAASQKVHSRSEIELIVFCENKNYSYSARNSQKFIQYANIWYIIWLWKSFWLWFSDVSEPIWTDTLNHRTLGAQRFHLPLLTSAFTSVRLSCVGEQNLTTKIPNRNHEAEFLDFFLKHMAILRIYAS